MGFTGGLAATGSPDTRSTDCVGKVGSVAVAGALGTANSLFSSLTGSRMCSLEKTVLTSLCIVSSAERRRASVEM
jgi:hypothetical protein